jgi:hypothetical protein
MTREILRLLPHFLIASVSGVLIAYPLELQLFASAIDRYVASSRANEVQAINERLAGLQEQLSTIEREAQRAEIVATEKLNAYLRELQGREASGVPGMGPAATVKRQAYEEAQREMRRVTTLASARIPELAAEAATLRYRRNELLEKGSAPPRELLARTQVFAALREADRAAAWSARLLTLIIVVIHLLPLLVKFFGRAGPYEYIAESELGNVNAQRIRDLDESSESIAGVMQRAFADALDESALNPRRQRIGT